MNRNTGFASSSKLLQKKWEERRLKAHQQKTQNMRTKLDLRPPKQYPHLVLRLKKVQKEEERQAAVDHDNQILLSKMTDIMKKKGRVDNWNDYEARSLNQQLREREQEKIAHQNIVIARKLESVRPMYEVEDWDEVYQRKHCYYLDLWSKDTKDFDMSPRGPHNRRARDWDYEDDFEDDENKSSRFPNIHSRETSGYTNRSKPESQQTKLPRIKTGRDVIAEQDAKLLFKATKQLVTPHEAIVRALIRKTHMQRMATKARFEEMYDLDLLEELQGVCSKEYDILLECLLAEKESADAAAINAAIYDNDIEDLVNMFCSRNPLAMSNINKAYRKEFEGSIEEDIDDKVVDAQCQQLLKLLIKPGRPSGEVDESLADQDALDLYEGSTDRFTDPEGIFMKIMGRRSMPQIRATFSNYKMVSGGESVVESMENDGCSQDFVKAVQTMNSCMFNSGSYFAQQIHENMGPNNKDLVNILLSRSEIDMGAIRKAYKKKYGVEMVDALLQRSGEAGSLLSQIAAKGANQPQPQAKAKGGHSQGASTYNPQTKRINGMVIGGQQKKQAVKRPDHLDHRDPARNNPLSRKTGAPATGGKTGGQAQGQGGGTQGAAAQSPAGKKKSKGGTAKTAKNFDVDSDVERIHEAMKGWGTNEEPLIEIMAGRDNAQRQQIRTKYPNKYDEDLIEALKSELTGDFEELIVGLLYTPVEYDVYCLHDAMDGLGTREAALIGIICCRTSKELTAIQDAYNDMYGHELRDDVSGDTSGDFKNLLMELLRSTRPQTESVDRRLADTDAKRIYQGGENLLDIQSEVFQEVMCDRSRAQVKATMDAYKRVSGQTLEAGLKEAMLGDEEEAYVALSQALSDPVEFYARRLNDAMQGAGTNDKQLIRIVVSRQEVDLADIKDRYKQMYGRSLEESIESECSGDYKRLLLELVK